MGGDANALMGKVFRSSLTGEIRMENPLEFPDYTLVDLWTRFKVSGNISQFNADEYLFKPVPLRYRTWIYHQWYIQRRVNTDAVSGIGMIQAVLAEKCIDAPISAGRWSPLLCHVPAVLGFCMTGDIVLILPGLCLISLQYLTVASNIPEVYRFSRLLMLPVRLVLMGILFWRFQVEGPLSLLGLLIGVFAFVIDFGFGDFGGNVLGYRFTCSYDIVKSLPNRVFICRRNGASQYEESFGKRGQVPECVSGMGSWDRTYVLIADIHGLLMELRPVKLEEWGGLQSNYLLNFEAQTFVGVDVFNEEVPTALAINAAGPLLHDIKVRSENERTSIWNPATESRHRATGRSSESTSPNSPQVVMTNL